MGKMINNLEKLIKDNSPIDFICKGQCSLYISKENLRYCSLAKYFKVNCLYLDNVYNFNECVYIKIKEIDKNLI
jgi:hypothetical protein